MTRILPWPSLSPSTWPLEKPENNPMSRKAILRSYIARDAFCPKDHQSGMNSINFPKKKKAGLLENSNRIGFKAQLGSKAIRKRLFPRWAHACQKSNPPNLPLLLRPARRPSIVSKRPWFGMICQNPSKLCSSLTNSDRKSISSTMVADKGAASKAFLLSATKLPAGIRHSARKSPRNPQRSSTLALC